MTEDFAAGARPNGRRASSPAPSGAQAEGRYAREDTFLPATRFSLVEAIRQNGDGRPDLFDDRPATSRVSAIWPDPRGDLLAEGARPPLDNFSGARRPSSGAPAQASGEAASGRERKRIDNVDIEPMRPAAEQVRAFGFAAMTLVYTVAILLIGFVAGQAFQQMTMDARTYELDRRV